MNRRSDPQPGTGSPRIVFLGSGDFAHDLLASLLEDGLEIAAVITPPERPAGRGLRITPSPLRELAEEHGLPFLQPGEPRDREFSRVLRDLHPDLLLVSDYGHLLPGTILEIPPRGCLNAHPSLLPRYRGAAPIQRALMDGAGETGVSLMLLDEGMDTGPVLSQHVVDIGMDDDAGTLRERLSSLAAMMIEEVLPRWLAGEISAHPQEESLATYADPIAKSELEIDWTRRALDIHNMVRALSPRPGAFSILRSKRIKILRTRPVGSDRDLAAGEMAAPDKETLLAGTGDGLLSLELLQPEGRKAIGTGEFLRGYRIRPGEGFGPRGTAGNRDG